MKRIIPLLKRGVTILQKHRYYSLAAMFVLAALGGTTTLLLIKNNTHRGTQQVTTVNLSKDSASSSAQEASTQSATSTTDKTSTGQPASTTATNTSTAPKAPSTSSQKNLIISPSSITATKGSSPSITIKSSDGKAINMPLGGGSNTSGKLFLNFPAGPAKPSWNGQITITNYATPGTYTLDLFAQDNSQAYYRATLTVIVVQPTMNISVQSLGYDASDDSVNYRIKIDRLYGFSEPIVGASGHSASESGLGCIYDIVDTNTIDMACGHVSGDRPTSGTLSISVATPNLYRYATASYSLPPSP